MAEAKSKAGRKPKYSAAEEMQSKVDAYFAECEIREKAPTVSGLAYYLGMSRRALVDYAHKDEFLPTIKAARQRVEIALEERLAESAPTGAIFNLKNNFGWKDAQSLEHTGEGGGPLSISVSFVTPDER